MNEQFKSISGISARKSRITLRQLTYFLEIVQKDFNISAAARNLNTAQPGISRQISDLEENLGVKLFKRTGKRLSGLTEEGHVILRKADQIKELIVQMETLKQASEPPSAPLFIASTPNVARYVSREAALPFMEEYPKASLRLHVAPLQQIHELIVENVVDVAIISGMPRELGLFQKLKLNRCFNWSYSIISRHDHPLVQHKNLNTRDVCKYDFVICSRSVYGDSMIDDVFHESISPRVAMAVADEEMVKACVKNLKNSIGIISTATYDNERDSEIRVLNYSQPQEYRAYYCIQDAHPQHKDVARFIRILKNMTSFSEKGVLGNGIEKTLSPKRMSYR